VPRLLALLLVPFVVLASSSARAQRAASADQNSALLYSDSTSFYVRAPLGWMLDSETGKTDGILAAIYRAGESWRTGQSVMYANLITLRSASESGFLAGVASAADDWLRRAGDAVITPLESIVAEDGSRATVKRFESPKQSAFEAVAYFHHGRAAPILVMTARSKKEFDRAFPDFVQLVKSYSKGPVVKHFPGTG